MIGPSGPEGDACTMVSGALRATGCASKLRAGGGGGGLQLCKSPSRPKGAYGTTDEDRFVLTCACSCD